MPRRDPQHPLQPAIYQALRAWHTVHGNPEDLLESLLVVRQERLELTEGDSPANRRLITNKVLLAGLEDLARKDEIGAKILRERFLNRETILKVAYMLNLSQDQVNRRQRVAIETLADLLALHERAFRQEQAQKILAYLPPPTYTHLFGYQELHESLLNTLYHLGPPWLVTITGLGGIGKTALADALVRQIIPLFHFDQIIWLRAETHTLSGESASPRLTFEDLLSQLAAHLFPQDQIPSTRFDQIRQVLKDAPFLVVVDNLETEADALYLFHQLSNLGGPSKFLITSRTRPPAQAGVFTHTLSELSMPDAAALLRHHAQITGLLDLANAPDENLLPILEAVGGNPLALKLVVSMALVLPLQNILADLPVGRTRTISQMYRHIYWKTWHTLSPGARTLLQVMPLVADSGGQLNHLQAISGLEEPDLLAGIQELVARSLLELRGTTWDRRYGIHRLTETFLCTEIVAWPEGVH